MTIKDLFILKFNKDFKLISSKVIEKKQKSLVIPNLSRTRSLADAFDGYFDYLYTEKSTNDKGFMVYYYDGDKNENGRSGSLATVSVVGDKYTQDKFPLSKKGGEVTALRAKKGYFLVVEKTKKTKDIEVRLEKMNY